jgi:hypothetical protein
MLDELFQDFRISVRGLRTCKQKLRIAVNDSIGIEPIETA